MDMLLDLRAKYSFDIQEINIDLDPAKYRNYLLEIPVIKIGVYTLRAPIDRLNLEITLRSAVNNIQDERKVISGKNKGIVDRFANWVNHHWIALVNLFFIGYLGVAFMAPILMRLGFEQIASIIYKVYGFFCHQLAFRSFFLFGDQIVYPREVAHVDELISFGAATGLNEMDLLGARNFLGDPLLGYKVALCERDVAIYGGIILFGLLFALLKNKVKKLPIHIWVIFALLPITLDGFSQLLSQIPLKYIAENFPFRESTPCIRTLTGFLFGVGIAWLGFPILSELNEE